MSLLDDESQVRVLLGPLNRVEPVALRRTRSRRPMLIAWIVAGALLATGAAIAAGFNPFTGIGAAGHTQRPHDVLAPAIIKRINASNPSSGANSSGSLLPSTSRLLGQLPNDRKIYVVGTSNDQLAILVTDHGRIELAAYGAPLTQAEPVTVLSFVQVKNGPHATPPLSYGVAKDGIAAVSFRAHGREHTVPVKNNVWFYEGMSNVLASITIHYANGTTRTLTH